MLLLGLALASPVDHARAALATQRPHTLVFDKESTGEVALEVTYTGPREASAVAHSPDGTYSVSVDATHMRLRLDDGSCASLDARTLFAEARRAALDPSTEPPGSQLIYRVQPDGSIDLSTSFQRDPDPPVFSWIADLTDAETTETHWVGRSDTSEWRVARETGHLTRMAVGDDALVLDHVRLEVAPMKAKPRLLRAREVCETPNAPALQRMVGAQLRLVASVDPLLQLSARWSELDPAARADAGDRQQRWWRGFFADDLPGWATSLEGGDWREQVVADMAAPAAFASFRNQLPPEARSDALQHYKQAWFARVGQQLVGGHVADIWGAFVGHVPAPGLDPAMAAVLQAALHDAALTEAEPLLQGTLVPVVEAGGEALQRALGTEAPPPVSTP